MGQADRRGTYQERRDEAIAKRRDERIRIEQADRERRYSKSNLETRSAMRHYNIAMIAASVFNINKRDKSISRLRDIDIESKARKVWGELY